MDWTQWLLAGLAVLFIGVAKAGFGGGLGMLVTPLCVLAFGPKLAIGILLPLLCLGDVFSLYHYWGKWRAANLRYLLPGVLLGIVLGVQWIGQFSPRQLNLAIGLVAVGFVLFQLARAWIVRAEGEFAPNHLVGVPCGVGIGVTSTFAHGAGPVAAMFLLPQRLPKEIFVGTNVLLFFWVNLLKLPFFSVDRALVDLPIFAPEALITRTSLLASLACAPLVPMGVWLGVWLNRKFSERSFTGVIYAILLVTGAFLIFHGGSGPAAK
jgi:uncharacterized membrane protein YfcA